jgi:hypothetical protein
MRHKAPDAGFKAPAAVLRDGTIWKRWPAPFNLSIAAAKGAKKQ